MRGVLRKLTRKVSWVAIMSKSRDNSIDFGSMWNGRERFLHATLLEAELWLLTVKKKYVSEREMREDSKR